jgi:hypothetical protein
MRSGSIDTCYIYLNRAVLGVILKNIKNEINKEPNLVLVIPTISRFTLPSRSTRLPLLKKYDLDGISRYTPCTYLESARTKSVGKL